MALLTPAALDSYDKIVYDREEKKPDATEGPMTRKFIYTAPFRRCWKAMGLNDDQLPPLEAALPANPALGDVMEGTGGARKRRIQLEGRGKRGGGRVIYLDVLEQADLYLLFAYPKNVQDDLTPDQKKAIARLVEEIRKE